MNKKKGRWWISFVAGFSYFLDLIVHIFFSRNFGSLSLSFFFFASNGSGSARKEGDQKLTRSSLIFQRKSVQSFWQTETLISLAKIAPNPLTNI
ncbi:hypothetical protein NC652_027217 [Populus alba x Populus x berolinensis]|nr:hypothetical protein NC652_027217 [Populus alba x Populus x berolinensis]